MKKLLITTLAAVSVGLCANAETAAFAENGVSFEESGVPDAGQSLFSIKTVDGQEKYVVTSGWWDTGASTEDLFTVTNVSGVTYPSRPQMWDGKANTKALAIDTTVPLMRNADGLNGAAQDINTPIFFDSVVQFTATDAATAPAADDKLVVWLYASEGVDADNPGIFGETKAITNLVVTAGYYEGSTLLTTNYLTNVAIEPESWHRLTIKSIFTGGFVKFSVWVDGTTKVTVDGVSEFYSLVEYGRLNYNSLKGVAFDGKGAVDDLVFTATVPDFAKEEEPEDPKVFNVAITIPENAELLGVMDANMEGSFTGSEGTYAIEVGTESIVVAVTYAGTVTNEGAQELEEGTWIIPVDVSSAAEGETVEVEIMGTEGSGEGETLYSITVNTPSNAQVQILTNEVQYVSGEATIPANTQYMIGAVANQGYTYKNVVLPVGWNYKEATGAVADMIYIEGTVTGNLSYTIPEPVKASSDVTVGDKKIEVDENGKISNITTADNGAKVVGNLDTTKFAEYYKVSVSDGILNIEIDPAVATPTINETVADKGDAIVVTDAAVALGVTNAKAGLWYGAQAYSDAACTTKIGGVTGWEKATGETVTVTATKPEGDKAFFKVVVDDQDHTPAEEPK